MSRSRSFGWWRQLSVTLAVVALVGVGLWWGTRRSEGIRSERPAAASASRVSAPPVVPVRAEQSAGVAKESWSALVAELEKARGARDQQAVAALLERLRACEDPALVEYLYARLCQTEEPDLWLGLLALKATRRLGPNGEVLEVDESLVSRVLAVISLPGVTECREHVAHFLELLVISQPSPCDSLVRYRELALAVARPSDVNPMIQRIAGHLGCHALLEQLSLEGGGSSEPTDLDELLVRLHDAAKNERAALVREFMRKLPVWEAARVVERLEAEPREYPSTHDPYQIALEELVRKDGGLDFLETKIWASDGESMGLLVRAVAEAESDRSYEILRTLVMEKNKLGSELPGALVGLCNMSNRRDSDRVCLSALQHADTEQMDPDHARLFAGAAILTAEKERQRGLLSERGIEPLRWVLASAQNEELVRAVLDECAKFDSLRSAVVPQISDELIWRADHVNDPELAAKLRAMAGR
jgi:hypothetical protein